MNNWLLLGPENGEKQEFISNLKKDLEKKHGEPVENYKFYAFDSNINDIVSLLKNGSLFSPHKVVIINDAQDIKGKKDIEPLMSYLEKPNEESTLILVSNSPSIEKKLQGAFPKKQQKIFWEMFENQKSGWVQNFFRKAGYSITPDAANLILDMVENNTEALKNECNRLLLFFSKEETITEENIEKYIYHSKEENVFTLFEKIAQGDLESTLEILNKLKLSGNNNPVQLLSGLVWQFRNLLNFQTLLSQNFGRQEIFTKLKLRSKKNQGIYNQGAQHYRLQDLKRIMALFGQYELRIKGARMELAVIQLELLLYHIIKNKGATLEEDFLL